MCKQYQLSPTIIPLNRNKEVINTIWQPRVQALRIAGGDVRREWSKHAGVLLFLFGSLSLLVRVDAAVPGKPLALPGELSGLEHCPVLLHTAPSYYI